MAREKSFKGSDGGKTFWTSRRIMLATIIVVGIIIGMLLQHYFVEPALGSSCAKEFALCKSREKALDEENNACHDARQDLEQNLAECEANG